ncbi:MAG: NAD(P)/FAD-dependent oxidoreductase [Geminicoccaceae bacterium]
MTETPKIAVVGAGIVGASIAWHLVGAGAEVTVLESGEPGGMATAASFAWINASWSNPEPYVRLRMRGMAEWRRLAGKVPGLPAAWCGGLCWDLPEAALREFARRHAAWGYAVRTVGRAEIAAIEPALAEPPALAVHAPAEGAVEPVRAALALLRDEAARGARLRTGMRVLALRWRGGHVVGVETAQGFVPADEVVVAAGAGTAELLATAEVGLRLETPPGLLAHSRPCPPLLQGIVLAPELHLRQTDEGRIVMGADFGGADPGADPAATARDLLARAGAMLRDAPALELDRWTVGYRPTPADGLPVIGRPEGMPGLYVAVMHSGMTLAPVVGQLAARELLTGDRDALLAPYGWREAVRGRSA